MRAALADGAPPADPLALINEGGARAIFPTPLDRGRILALIEECVPPPPAAPAAGENASALRAEVEHLKKKLAQTERELRIARNADAMKREEELGLAELKLERLKSSLGVELDIDYLAPDLAVELAKAFDALLACPTISLPVMPQIGLKLQDMIRQGSVSFAEAASVIALETGLSARVLSICNSPLYCGVERISNLQQAVARLGEGALLDIAMTAVSENLFRTQLKGMSDLVERLWRHSLTTAHASKLVGETLGVDHVDDLFLMGLLHDIGKLLIAYLTQQGFDHGIWNTRIMTPRIMLDIMNRRHNELGVALLSKWQYPETFIEVVGHHNDDATIHTRSESCIIVYYANVLTRKLGFSLKADAGDPLSEHDLAQALNLAADMNARIEQSSREMIVRIQETYFV
ncbi:MAG: HDOD domain protein [candidate division BRC1 bacterium ADurb.BinA364]|nr:MAG: HDOD domain protein [candidate division BRC1 bacterium ADurb.BinA364]